MQNELVPSYLLHARPYRDTSMIIDLWTPSHGRFAAVARGIRSGRSRQGIQRAWLRPFLPLWTSWQGMGDMKTLLRLEAQGLPLPLSGDALYCGFYLNELLLRALPALDPHPDLFLHYVEALGALADTPGLDVPLRRFELRLLDELGYGLAFSCGPEPLDPTREYQLDASGQFVLVPSGEPGMPGSDLLAIARDDWQSPDVQRLGKRLLRRALQPLTGDRPLRSRELLRALHQRREQSSVPDR